MTLLINNLMFWIAVILCVVSGYKMYLSKRMDGFGPREWVISEKMYRILFALAILAAVLVRIYKFGQVPGGFNQDGAMAAVDAKALAEYGTDRFGMRFPVHLTAWGYGQMSALLSYLMVPFIRLFGFSPWSVRMPSLVMSFVGLACLYGFVRDVFGKNTGLIVLGFGAINPWHILQSRWALDCNLYAHFFMIGVFLLNRAFLRKRYREYLIGSMVMFGLCMYCYGISIYTMPLFLVAACIYLLATKKIAIKEVFLSAVVYLLVGGSFILVMAINFFGWETIETPFLTIPYFPDSVRAGDILFFSSNKCFQLRENFVSLFQATLLQVKDLPWNDVRNFGTMYLFSIPFVVFGIYVLFCEFRKKTGAILLAIYLGTGVWCGLVTNDVSINRINIIYYANIILVGIGLREVIWWVSLPRLKYGIAAVYAVIFLLFAKEYFTGYAVEINAYFRKDLGDALSALQESDAREIYIVTNEAHSVSEILTLFWCDIDAEYFQGKNTLPGELPYAEKYHYDKPGEITIDEAKDADYLVTGEDLELFDEKIYSWEQFGNYYVVTKK